MEVKDLIYIALFQWTRKTSIALIFPLAALTLMITTVVEGADDTFSGEYIWRKQNERLFPIKDPKLIARPLYPWEYAEKERKKITKEFLRCRGNILNPPRTIEEGGKKRIQFDCGGAEKHSLPLRNGKEFIYPILLELLNYVQNKSGKRIVITSGHRCPQHHAYVIGEGGQCFSKHMVGAQVAFYVQGLEQQPLAIIDMLQDYFKESPEYCNLEGYVPFYRYEKELCAVTIAPWCNKEVFIKLFRHNEGRNKDNDHNYPYIDIQVRVDRQSGEKILPSWPQAQNYLNY